jgi:hypothetical protein
LALNLFNFLDESFNRVKNIKGSTFSEVIAFSTLLPLLKNYLVAPLSIFPYFKLFSSVLPRILLSFLSRSGKIFLFLRIHTGIIQFDFLMLRLALFWPVKFHFDLKFTFPILSTVMKGIRFALITGFGIKLSLCTHLWI